MNHNRAVGAVLAAALLLAGCREETVVETPPRLTAMSPVLYPEELWDAGVEGTTVLRILVDTTGMADSARVERPSGYSAFDSAAMATVEGTRFTPATRDGVAVRQWTLLPVEFRINAAPSGAAPDTSPNNQLPE